MSDLVVPALGESISEAIIAKWLKKPGDAVAVDEPVVDLETDKVSVQLPAPTAGVLAEQSAAEGATVKVGQVIGKITDGAAAAATSSGKPTTVVATTTAAAPAPAVTTTTVAATPSSAEASAAPTATTAAAPPTAGVVAPRDSDKNIPATAVSTTAAQSTPGTFEQHQDQHQEVLSPARRRAAREREGIAVSAMTVQSVPIGTPAGVTLPVTFPTSTPVATVGANEELVPMSPLRKRIAERLVAAQHTAAVLTTFNEVDMTNLLEVRARNQDAFVAKHGTKVGFMSFFTKAVLAALVDFPMLNAEVRGTDIVYKKHYDIGIAVGSGRGLVVPVVRNADRMGFAEIEKAIAALATKAKDNKLTLDDLAGGTFTITNGGIYGSMMSTPLLNLPQTGILGMHNIVKRAVVVSEKGTDKIEIRPMMYLALSYDHRLVDGREAVQFLVGVKERIENPERMLFSL